MQLPPTPVGAADMIRLRSNLNEDGVAEDEILLMMWELKLTPRSVPVAVGDAMLAEVSGEAG